MIIYQTIIFIR